MKWIFRHGLHGFHGLIIMIHEELTKEIISAFYEVHKILGFGFLEQVYQNALYKELIRRNLKCECQKELNVYYKNEIVGTL